MEKKYAALRMMIWVYRIGAVLLAAGGLFYGGLNHIFGIAVAAIIIAVGIYAFGELLNLFIDIEENTRRTALMMQKSTRAQNVIRRTVPIGSDDEPAMDSFAIK